MTLMVAAASSAATGVEHGQPVADYGAGISRVTGASHSPARHDAAVEVAETKVSWILARAGMSKLSDLARRESVQRYDHAAPGAILRFDTKKLGRFE